MLKKATAPTYLPKRPKKTHQKIRIRSDGFHNHSQRRRLRINRPLKPHFNFPNHHHRPNPQRQIPPRLHNLLHPRLRLPPPMERLHHRRRLLHLPLPRRKRWPHLRRRLHGHRPNLPRRHHPLLQQVPRLRSHQRRPGPLRRRPPNRPLVGRVLHPGPGRVVRRVLRHGRGNGSLRPGRRVGPRWCHRRRRWNAWALHASSCCWHRRFRSILSFCF